MQKLADIMLKHFYDTEPGGFFFTADDHESLFVRVKNLMDEAVPSGNAVAIQVLIRLSYLEGNGAYLHAAENSLQLAWASLQDYPSAYATVLSALAEALKPPQIIIIRGNNIDLAAWRAQYYNKLALQAFIFAISNNITSLPEFSSQQATCRANCCLCMSGQ